MTFMIILHLKPIPLLHQVEIFIFINSSGFRLRQQRQFTNRRRGRVGHVGAAVLAHVHVAYVVGLQTNDVRRN